MPWLTVKELAKKLGITEYACWKAHMGGRIPGTRWKGRIFFNEEQVSYAEKLYAHSPRRGFRAKNGGEKNDNGGKSGL